MGMPNRVLPGGYVFGSTGIRNPKYGFQDSLDLVQVDWDGNIVWKFDKYERVKDPRQKPTWMARQHHDYQREGNPVGYYVPGMDPLVAEGNTLIVAHKNLTNTSISDKLLQDDTIVEVDWDGKIVWEWICSEHFDEMDFGEDAKNTIARNPNFLNVGVGMGDWMHMNSMATLGPNKWFDAGDERFHPDNIIFSGREANIIAIISKTVGKIVWQLGPSYNATPALRDLGQIIGQHHAHLIPQGLPGEGNMLVFDNGGWSGYGSPNPGSPTGNRSALRDSSRVLEFDPISLEIVWQYSAQEAGFRVPAYGSEFYSSLVSSAQRLPNGNTLITEGTRGRIFEVTPEHEAVWEYVSPYYGKHGNEHLVYRSYRVGSRDGDRGSFCWPQVGGVALCADSIILAGPPPPIGVSRGEGLTVEIEAHTTPVLLNANVFEVGTTSLVDNITLEPSLTTELHLDFDPGVYTVTINGGWDEGDIFYAFQVEVR